MTKARKTARKGSRVICVLLTLLLCACGGSSTGQEQEEGKETQESTGIFSIDTTNFYISELRRVCVSDNEEASILIMGFSETDDKKEILLYDNDGSGWKQKYVYGPEPIEHEPGNLDVLGTGDVTGDGISELFLVRHLTGSAWGYEAAVISSDGGEYHQIYEYESSGRDTDAVMKYNNECYIIFAKAIFADDESNGSPHRMRITVYRADYDKITGKLSPEAVFQMETIEKYEKMKGWEIEEELIRGGFLEKDDSNEFGSIITAF